MALSPKVGSLVPFEMYRDGKITSFNLGTLHLLVTK